MKRVLLMAAALFAASLTLVGFAPSASAYPEQTCDVVVSGQVVVSGDDFTASASAEAGTTEADPRAAAEGEYTWVMTFNDETRSGTGAVFTQTFTAPEVTEATRFPLTARVVMPDAATTCERSVDITVNPGDSVITPPGGGGGELPNTGGPRAIFLYAGLVMVAGGAVAVRQSRRSADRL